MTFWPARNGKSVAIGDAGFSTATGAKPMLETALQYANRSWRVIPCRSDKISRIRNWQVAASCDPKTIITWWTQWPSAWIPGTRHDPGDIAKIGLLYPIT